jgi:nitroimidazol reductase NimA-like FMN-containing flavoprotein (pyridoxamine 5'-phosphate oxidase superfamily)
MKKIVTQIRDIHHIEKELQTNPAGVLALNVKDDEIVQIATTFLYQDKNVYFFLDDKDDLLENLKYETPVSFIIVKNEKTKKNSKQDFTPVYNILSISIAGQLKKVDDEKLFDSLRKNYLKKYSSKVDEKEKPRLNNVIFIDTEEIQAFEETGG